MFSGIDESKVDWVGTYNEIFQLYGSGYKGYGNAGLNRVIDMYDEGTHGDVLIYGANEGGTQGVNEPVTFIIKNLEKFRYMVNFGHVGYYNYNRTIYVNAIKVEPKEVNGSAEARMNTAEYGFYTAEGAMFNSFKDVQKASKNVFVAATDTLSDLDVDPDTDGLTIHAKGVDVRSITNFGSNLTVLDGSITQITNYGSMTALNITMISDYTMGSPGDLGGMGGMGGMLTSISNYGTMTLINCSTNGIDNFGILLKKNGNLADIDINIQKLTQSVTDHKGILAIYGKDGTMLDIDVRDVSTYSRFITNITVDENMDNAKFFLWQDFITLIPMCEAVEFKLN